MAGLRVSLPTCRHGRAGNSLSLHAVETLFRCGARVGARPIESAVGNSAGVDVVTPASLTQLLLRIREARLTDLAHPASAQPMAVNKRLERTQAAG
jgi:hypothetical protein